MHTGGLRLPVCGPHIGLPSPRADTLPRPLAAQPNDRFSRSRVSSSRFRSSLPPPGTNQARHRRHRRTEGRPLFAPPEASASPSLCDQDLLGSAPKSALLFSYGRSGARNVAQGSGRFRFASPIVLITCRHGIYWPRNWLRPGAPALDFSSFCCFDK